MGNNVHYIMSKYDLICDKFVDLHMADPKMYEINLL